MHNRARLVVGSFLTKDLGIDWRWGERWFMRLLVDGDEANNNGNWQWIASVGTDPQPRSAASTTPPATGALRPEGGVRAPLRAGAGARPRELPGRALDDARRGPAGAGCVIGEDYPEPIVDHKVAREEALARYRVQ